MSQLSVKCFGVGDGWPCADRNHSSFLYRFGKTSFLIDCGEPLDRSYKASGLSYDAFDRIFLSHLHADHIGGFFMLMQGLWLESRKKELLVHMPREGLKPLRQMLNAACIFDELLEFRLRFEALRAGTAVLSKDVRVTPFRSTHLDRLRKTFQKKYPQKFEAFCFLIEAGKMRIGHSADIGSPEDLAPLLSKPLDLLVCELAHFRPEELFDYLQQHEIKRIAFIHLGRSHWEHLKKIRRLSIKMLPDVEIHFPKDQEEIRF
ncbi:MBL fold metallo-hydrolase [Pedosphaera parvula]|uniref:Beta-lactamase domain protein n=1 Tax=Pedosphaera parvula (strain Ellin514) TaxID=320771 RepID=B9XJM5_PEDPL|nr:MBL fold metallo-hydrolase [Pedosphaera parvula]EEF59901.1 beta-lactamase domain protein [Pedosphaera parvula Ellin514]